MIPKTFPASVAMILIVGALAACASGERPDSGGESSEDTSTAQGTPEALAPSPVVIVQECGVEEGKYTSLDDGAAVEFDAPWIDTLPFTCVADKIGLSEATLATGTPNEKMQADGYSITIKPGRVQTAVIERD